MKKKNDGKDIYRKKSYTPPKKSIPITDSNYECIYNRKTLISELCKKQQLTDREATLLKYSILLVKLGEKGFGVSYFDSKHSELDFKNIASEQERYLQLRAELKIRQKDCARIFKILDKHQMEVSHVELIKQAIKAHLLSAGSMALMKGYWENQKAIKLTSSHPSLFPLWENFIKRTVKDLIDIGYAKNSAYRITAELLLLSRPDIFKGIKPEHIKGRYTYKKKSTTTIDEAQYIPFPFIEPVKTTYKEVDLTGFKE